MAACRVADLFAVQAQLSGGEQPAAFVACDDPATFRVVVAEKRDGFEVEIRTQVCLVHELYVATTDRHHQRSIRLRQT